MKERAKPSVDVTSCGSCKKPMGESRTRVCGHRFCKACSSGKEPRTACPTCGVIQGTTRCGSCKKPMTRVCGHIFCNACCSRKEPRTACPTCGVVQGTAQWQTTLILYKTNFSIDDTKDSINKVCTRA